MDDDVPALCKIYELGIDGANEAEQRASVVENLRVRTGRPRYGFPLRPENQELASILLAARNMYP